MDSDSAPDRTGGTDDTDDAPILIRDKIPLRLWLAAGAGMLERSAYYGSMIMTQNYVQNAANDKSRPGVLGRGQAVATQIQFAFTFVNSLTPFIGALVADSVWGRHRTILYSFPIYLVGLGILCGMSYNTEAAQRAGLGPFVICLMLIAIGSGGIRVNMTAFIGDQYLASSTDTFEDKRGRKVKTDQALTLQYIYSAYYWMINIGSLTGIITTLLESKVSFGVAFMVPVAAIVLGMVMFIASNKVLIRHGPSKGSLTRTVAYVWTYLQVRLRLPRSMIAVSDSDYDEQFVKGMSDTWKGCRIFSTFTVAWLCWDQAENNFISQAGQMKTIGVPNDMLYFLNPVVLVIMIPCFEELIFPLLRARGAKMAPLTRIFIGFVILTGSMVYVAGLQRVIYSRGPCYDHPRACPGSPNGSEPNDISVFAQLPVYVLQSIAEIFSQIAATQYAYSHSPADMKSTMQAMAQAFGTISALLGIAMAPVSRDPLLIIMYASLAAAMAITSMIFWFFFMLREGVGEEPQVVIIPKPQDTVQPEQM